MAMNTAGDVADALVATIREEGGHIELDEPDPNDPHGRIIGATLASMEPVSITITRTQ